MNTFIIIPINQVNKIIIAMQNLIVQPEGTVTLALNQMRNATFNCECTARDTCGQPFWSPENEEKTITTDDSHNEDT